MIVKFKGIKNWENHIYYLFDEKKHENQEIIGDRFFDNFNKNQQIIDSYHFGKNGQRSKMLSVMISFNKGTSKTEAQSRFKRVYLSFYEFVNKTYSLGLNNDELKHLVNQIPFVFHGKESNPHFHSFLNRVIYSKRKKRYISINFSKKRFSSKFRELAGWDISQDEINQSSKNYYTYKLDQLKQEILKYRNINEKLDKYIDLALKDLKRGHSDKALKKFEKIKRNNP